LDACGRIFVRPLFFIGIYGLRFTQILAVMLATVLNLYRLLAWAFFIAGGWLCFLLITTGPSQQSLYLGLAGLLLSLAPLLDATGRVRESRGWNRLAILFLAGWLGIIVWLWRQAPDGRAPEGARVANRYLDDWRYPQASMGNLIPELDQVLLGLKLSPMIDPLLSPGRPEFLSTAARQIYAELETDPEFKALGTVLPHAYDDLWTDRINHGHYFLYVPPNLPVQPRPALIFLHGGGGNLKAYTWLLSKVADELGLVLIVPSFGMGDWEEPGTTRTLRAVLDDAGKRFPIERQNVHLAGLSSGGIGVCLAPLKMGAELRSLILISPMMEKEAIRSAEFLAYGLSHDIRILTGEQDRRVTLERLQEDTQVLRSNRVLLSLETLPDADHFMFFTHREQVLSRIATWIRQSRIAFR
jgi:pimeloyl-ACP methyl ester carboxylesterase